MGGPHPPTFQKVGPQNSHKNVIKLVRGGRSGRPVKKWSLRFFKRNQRMVFQELVARFGLYEMLEHCWKRHSKPKLNAYLETFFWGLAPRTQSFPYPLLSKLEHTTGYRDSCVLPLLKQSHFSERLKGVAIKNFSGATFQVLRTPLNRPFKLLAV